MKKTEKPGGIFARAYGAAAQDFMREKDKFGEVSMKDVAFIGMAIAIAALLYTLASGAHIADALFAGALATVGLAGVSLAKFGIGSKNEQDNDESNA